jgi:hypothetical protein
MKVKTFFDQLRARTIFPGSVFSIRNVPGKKVWMEDIGMTSNTADLLDKVKINVVVNDAYELEITLEDRIEDILQEEGAYSTKRFGNITYDTWHVATEEEHASDQWICQTLQSSHHMIPYYVAYYDATHLEIHTLWKPDQNVRDFAAVTHHARRDVNADKPQLGEVLGNPDLAKHIGSFLLHGDTAVPLTGRRRTVRPELMKLLTERARHIREIRRIDAEIRTLADPLLTNQTRTKSKGGRRGKRPHTVKSPSRILV